MSQGFTKEVITPLPLSVANGGTGTTTATGTAGSVVLSQGPTLTGSVTIAGQTFPAADGNPGEALQTDGAGQLAYVPMNVGRKNAIMAGDFSTNPFQRGSTVSSPSSGDFVMDRFAVVYTSTAAIDASVDAQAPAVAEAGMLVTRSLKIDVTTADATVAAGDFWYLKQGIEGYNFAKLAQRNMTLSFWVYSTKTGTFSVFVQNSGADRSWVSDVTIDSANTWEKKIINIDASPSAGTWNYFNGLGLTVGFSLMCGSTYHAPANDSWQSGDYRGSSTQDNYLDSASNDIYFALIQLEEGDVATSFEIQQRGQIELDCFRYYYDGRAQNNLSSQKWIANQSWNSQRFLTRMRTSPTVIVYSPTTGASGKIYNSSTASDVTASIAYGLSMDYCIAVTGGFTAGQNGQWYVTASAEL